MPPTAARGLVSMMAACLLALGCVERDESTSNFHLATVAVAQRDGLVFIANPGHGPVDVLQLPSGATWPGARFVTRLSDPHRRHVVRLAVDDAHRRLWIADAQVVQAYDIRTLRETRKHMAQSAAYPERFGDLALDAQGNAFVLARGGARIYRVDATSLEMHAWLEVSEQASDAAIVLANRLLASRDGRRLFMASPSRDELLRIDLASKAIERLPLTPDTHLTCGLLFWMDASTIRALDCTGEWEADLTPTEQFSAASIDFRGRTRPRGAAMSFR